MVVVPEVVKATLGQLAREIAVTIHNRARATGVAEEAAAREVVV